MCEVFEVSRSGYYAWRNRQQKEAKDQWLVDLVVACQRQSKQTYGIRRVRRWIQRRTGKLVNVKAILRVMRKLNLLSVVRRRRPYTRYQQAVHRYPNLLDRNFDQAKPNQLGNGHHLHPGSGQHAVHVRCTGFVWKGRPCVEDRR